MQSKHSPESHLYPKWGTYRAKRPRLGSLAQAGAAGAEEPAEEAASETAVQLAHLLRQALGGLYPRRAVEPSSLADPTVSLPSGSQIGRGQRVWGPGGCSLSK